MTNKRKNVNDIAINPVSIENPSKKLKINES